MKIKRFIAIIMVAMTAMLFSSCSQKDKISLPDDVSKITVAPYYSDDMTFEYTDKTKIAALTDYFKSLEPLKTSDSPENYVGAMTYSVTVVSSSEDVHYTIAGSTFFKIEDGSWMLIQYEKGEEFVELLKNNIPDIQAEKPLFDYNNLAGKIK